MPRTTTLLGGAAGGGIGLLQPHLYNVAHAWLTGQWSPEAIDSEATILTAIGMSALGVLLVARERIVEDLRSSRFHLPGGLSRFVDWLKPEIRRVSTEESDERDRGPDSTQAGQISAADRREQ